MLLSDYFIPTIKENPKEAEVRSHNLMLRAGLISQHISGVYHWLPLGLRVIQKATKIIREHLERNNILELATPYLQNSKLWQISNRYDSYGKEMMKLNDRHGQELVLGPTNEEVMTDIAKKFFISYKILPKIIYQIQWKFRDEIRPRFGILRGREFLMKDAYSFDQDHQSSYETYKKIFRIYNEIFHDMGLICIAAEAPSSEIGGKISHEFHVISEVGESKIFFDKKILNLKIEDKKNFNFYKSYYSKTSELEQKDIRNSSEILSSKSIEIGQIFNFDTKYSDIMKSYFTNHNGENISFYMGSYGIGISRLIAAAIEQSNDDRGIIWPKNLSPFQISLINLEVNDAQSSQISDKIYDILKSHKIEVLYDNTAKQSGYKINFHNLIGFSLQILVSSKLIKDHVVEVYYRKTQKSVKIAIEHLEQFILENIQNIF